MDPLSRLFGSFVRLKVLRLFLFNDDLSFTLVDTAFRTKAAKDAVRKELSALTAAGLVRKKVGKGAAQFQTNRKFPYYEALQTFIRSTTNLSDADIVNSLKKAGSVRLVVLSGLFTGAVETKVDLLVVGDKLDEKALDTSIRALEAELGRELRFASFTTEDFKYRRGVYDRLLRDIFDFSHRVLLDKMGM
ncbi:MAG: seg [Parcubacteria group bacterium]|nr:seg [Parcubacteria group bacterium]